MKTQFKKKNMGLKKVDFKIIVTTAQFKKEHFMWLRQSNVEKDVYIFLLLQGLGPFLFEGPRLLINLPKN